jgi:osmotically-inducible protein OsmY
MKAFIFGLLLGIVLTLGTVWYMGGRGMRVDDQNTNQLKHGADETKSYLQDKAASLNLSLENIKEEMARDGRVMRQKAADLGHSVADATADTRITAAIKGKLLADPDLSVLSISVNTTGGVVTISGTASSPANIRKAIQLAWDTDGVNQVISTIQVKE